MQHDRTAAATNVIGICLVLVAGAAPAAAQRPDTVPAPADTAAIPLTADEQSPVRIVIRTGEGTPAGRALQRVLREPHIVMDGRGRPVALPRGAHFPANVVIVAPRATVAGRVQGSVVVVGGDLFMHPGGTVTGDAIAIGGGAYRSTLATVAGARVSFRDETFDAAREPGIIALTHRSTRLVYQRAALSWPLGFGFRIPSYNRIDGVVLPWGPFVSLAGGRVEADPTITYRSDLGAFDPGVEVTTTVAGLAVTADARRATFSNDRWIRGDLTNSLITLVAGRDARNYYRADRFEVRVARHWTPGALILEPYAGARNERGWSTGAELSRDSHPWSLSGRDSISGIYRPNPPVFPGRIQSLLAGGSLRWAAGGVRTRFSADMEFAGRSPDDPAAPGAANGFRQATLHGTIDFPTFGNQRFAARSHAVTSTKGGDRPPPQRYAYMGGGGTIPTMDMLEEGGTELFFFEGSYIIPVPVIQLPFVGSPTVTLRYMAGGAGIDRLPELTQNVGVKVGTRFIGVQYLVDPATGEKSFGIGLTFGF